MKTWHSCSPYRKRLQRSHTGSHNVRVNTRRRLTQWDFLRDVRGVLLLSQLSFKALWPEIRPRLGTCPLSHCPRGSGAGFCFRFGKRLEAFWIQLVISMIHDPKKGMLTFRQSRRSTLCCVCCTLEEKKNDISKCESIKPAIPETASRTAASLALYSTAEQLKPVRWVHGEGNWQHRAGYIWPEAAPCLWKASHGAAVWRCECPDVFL